VAVIVEVLPLVKKGSEDGRQSRRPRRAPFAGISRIRFQGYDLNRGQLSVISYQLSVISYQWCVAGFEMLAIDPDN